MKFDRPLLSSCVVTGMFSVIPISLICIMLSTLVHGQGPTATSTPESGHDASTIMNQLAGSDNSTLSIPVFPEGFDLTYEIGGPKLNKTSCLMNAVDALKHLAVGDWDSKIIDGTEYRHEVYREVSIVITAAKRRRNIQARFVIMAVCYGMREMISQKKFEFAQFEMLWHGQKIGWVQVINHPTGAGSTTEEKQPNETLDAGGELATSLSTNGTIRLQPLNITSVIAMDNTHDPAEARLDVTFEPYGVNLGIYDVFVPVIGGLGDLARFPSNHECTGLMIGLQGFNGFICFLPIFPLRTSPPFLYYGWVTRAIARIPTYMLGTGRFGEVTIKVLVDGVAVGFGRMSTAPDCDDDGLLSASLGVAES